MLSGALYHALLEPYRERPGVRLVAVSDPAELARTPPAGRPHLAALTRSADGRPVFVVIGPGGAVGEPPRLETDGPPPSQGPLKIRLTQPKDRWARLDSLKVVFADEHGRLIASDSPWQALAPALSAEGGLTIASDRTTPPVTVEMLEENGSRSSCTGPRVTGGSSFSGHRGGRFSFREDGRYRETQPRSVKEDQREQEEERQQDRDRPLEDVSEEAGHWDSRSHRDRPHQEVRSVPDVGQRSHEDGPGGDRHQHGARHVDEEGIDRIHRSPRSRLANSAMGVACAVSKRTT